MTKTNANVESASLQISTTTQSQCKRTSSLSETGCEIAAAANDDDAIVSKKQKLDLDSDQGHRYGNFRNYYRFHPTNNRTEILNRHGGILDVISQDWKKSCLSANKNTVASSSHMVFRYLDIGCNEGDLTLEIAKLLSTRMQQFAIQVTAVDLDPVLIERARTKSTQLLTDTNIQSQFQVTDVLSEDFAKQWDNECFDLTTIFSTTMWIHIHGGDEGLRRVLQHICRFTKQFIVIEPQSSRSYRDASARLRRRGGGSLNLENLQLRANAEVSMAKILSEFGFEQVGVEADSDDTQNDVSAFDAKTAWNRSLQIYRRLPDK